MRALSLSLLLPIICIFAQACATSKPAPDGAADQEGACADDGEGPPPEAFESLADDAFAAACDKAKADLGCKGAVSAEGTPSPSCACHAFGNAEGAGRLTITGTNAQDGAIDAEFELVDGGSGAGWTLGKLVTNRGAGPK